MSNIFKEYFNDLIHAAKTDTAEFSLLFALGYFCWLSTLLLLISLVIGFAVDPIKTLIILAFIVLPIILGYITYKNLSKNGRAKQ